MDKYQFEAVLELLPAQMWESFIASYVAYKKLSQKEIEALLINLISKEYGKSGITDPLRVAR